MNKIQVSEIQLRLKAPINALDKITKGHYLPMVFAQVALDELKKIKKLTMTQRKRKACGQ